MFYRRKSMRIKNDWLCDNDLCKGDKGRKGIEDELCEGVEGSKGTYVVFNLENGVLAILTIPK